MSLARFAEEARFVLRPDSQYMLLMLTDEGLAMLSRFARSVGADFAGMQEYEKEHPGSIASWINKHYSELFCFLCAVEFCFLTIMHAAEEAIQTTAA